MITICLLRQSQVVWILQLLSIGKSSYSIQLMMSSSADLYEDLVYYFKYATSAYSPVCPRPNGNSLVIEVDIVS